MPHTSKTLRAGRLLAVLLIIPAAAACSGDSVAMADHDAAMSDATHGQPGHDMSSMQMDTAAMRRHAQEMDSIVTAMRPHVAAMRQQSAQQWHSQAGAHVTRVAGMLALIDRHMREMDMGMNMDDAHMGSMMGMEAADHTRMMDELKALRADAELLQTASAAEVARVMPAHLDRLDWMLGMMAQSGAHMGGDHMGGHGH
jgi:hypothetical protein